MGFFDNPSYVAAFAAIREVKRRRSQFIDRITSGELSIVEVFDHASNDEVLASMKVLGAIEAHPDTGKVSTRRAFGDLGISEAGLIADVSADQIEALPAAIASHIRP